MENNNNQSLYTMDMWSKDGTLRPKIGQVIEPAVFYELRDSVPPTTYRYGYFQPGEAYTMDLKTGKELYMTFKALNIEGKHDYYEYVGLKKRIEGLEEGITLKKIGDIITESVKNYLNESFASSYLKKLIMANGGFADRNEGGFDRYYGWRPSTYPVGKYNERYDAINRPFPNILNKLSDSDLLYRATHIDEFEEKLTIACKNGTVLSIPITTEEYDKAEALGDNRADNFNFPEYDGKNAYQSQKEVDKDKEFLKKIRKY